MTIEWKFILPSFKINVIEKDYTEKYEQYKIVAEIVVRETAAKGITMEETDIFKELSAYRLERSSEEKIKLYYIYNDY